MYHGLVLAQERKPYTAVSKNRKSMDKHVPTPYLSSKYIQNMGFVCDAFFETSCIMQQKCCLSKPRLFITNNSLLCHCPLDRIMCKIMETSSTDSSVEKRNN